MDTTQTNEGTSSDSINSVNDYYDLTKKLNFLHKFTIVFCIVGVIVSLFYIVCALPREVESAYSWSASISYPLDFALIGRGIGALICHIVLALFVLSQIKVAQNLQQLKNIFAVTISDGFNIVVYFFYIMAVLCLICFFPVIGGDYKEVVENLSRVIYRTVDIEEMSAYVRISQIMNLRIYFSIYLLYGACCLWYFALTVELIGANTELVLETQRKEKELVLETQRKEKEAARIKESARIKQIRTLLSNMIQIPGKEYMMCKYVVTQELYEAVMEKNPSYFKGDPTRPVEDVSWDNIQKFLEKLNDFSEIIESGLEYRLPTADEWEYACRAGASGGYCKLADGTEITKENLSDVAWFENNSNRETHPVGQKNANAYGLYDMHGNVSEWTSTISWGIYVCCVGSYLSSAEDCRLPHRIKKGSFSGAYDLGFRLCATRRADKV